LWWTWVCRYLCSLILFPSCIYPIVVKQDHMVVILLVFWRIFILISVIALLIYTPSNCIPGYFYPYPFQDLLLFDLLLTTILTEWEKNLNVILLCISLMAKDGGHFFHEFIGHLCFVFWTLSCSFAHLLIGLFFRC
jgi:hypothetical protein